MARTVGFFIFRIATPEDVWNQCDEPLGAHGDLRFVPGDCRADHIVCFGLPIAPDGRPRHRGLARRWSRLRGRYEYDRACLAFRSLGRSRRDITVLFLEPASNIPAPYYAAASEFAERVHAPDPRAPIPTRLPSWWWIDEPLAQLRATTPPGDKPAPLVAITSGKTDIAGHGARMDFLRELRRAGVPMHLFGRGLPADLAPHTTLRAKGTALHPARMALVIENDPAGSDYVSEKLWDALLCWCLPLYHGSRAADGMVPTTSFIRVPSLDAAGVSVVRDALADPGLWHARLDAIAEARRRVLSDLRLVEWVARNLPA